MNGAKVRGASLPIADGRRRGGASESGRVDGDGRWKKSFENSTGRSRRMTPATFVDENGTCGKTSPTLRGRKVGTGQTRKRWTKTND
ncbi:unnamed protein product [Macrosiphum euphorbiae]|uniref:Uncharacterized protein n=1 Tax=Macrosiphum euphorbiae TaxID=13131 RepID=A0AAV0WFU9_9HEMI|nr:unnamed protein product [Macrosiphum euphorbiae]